MTYFVNNEKAELFVSEIAGGLRKQLRLLIRFCVEVSILQKKEN
jgi:hypothetical protein